jgi:polyisoprenoid-binding protein YceI
MAWEIDPAHSQIEFSVKHMMITRVRGRFGSFDGTLDLDLENPEESHVEGTIDVAGIDTNEEDRDKHLRSEDFFDAENYPQMKFRSTRIERIGEDHYAVYGDLTIKDQTRQIEWDVIHEGSGQDPWGNQRLGFTAETRINRKDFNLNWNVALETGGWLVGDEIDVTASVQAVQEEPEPEMAMA